MKLHNQDGQPRAFFELTWVGNEVMLLEETVTRRVSEGFLSDPSLTRWVTKQAHLLSA